MALQDVGENGDLELRSETAHGRRRLYNEELALVREPGEQLNRIAEQNAADFAKSIVQVGLVLNGGAILAIPAIGGLLADGLRDVLRPIVLAGCFFGAGMSFSWIAGIVAYFAICLRQLVHQHDAYEDMLYVKAYHAESVAEYNLCMSHAALQAAELEKENNRYGRLRWWGVGFSLGSFICFIAGAALAGITLLHKTAEEPAPPEPQLPAVTVMRASIDPQ